MYRESVSRLGHSPRLSLGGICIAGTFPSNRLRRPPVEKDGCSGETRITPVSLPAQGQMRGICNMGRQQLRSRAVLALCVGLVAATRASATEYGFSTYGLGGNAFGAGVTPPAGTY